MHSESLKTSSHCCYVQIILNKTRHDNWQVMEVIPSWWHVMARLVHQGADHGSIHTRWQVMARLVYQVAGHGSIVFRWQVMLVLLPGGR